LINRAIFCYEFYQKIKSKFQKQVSKDYAMRSIRNQQGAAMLEFAIALPLILLLLFGTIEFGVLFYNKQVITNASREGVRAGITKKEITEPTRTEIKDIVINYSNDKLICLKNNISLTYSDIDVPDFDAQNDLKVTVTVAYDFLFSQIIGLGPSIDISAYSLMRKEPMPS
jgi:Flp pilus assembly protein TadG